MASAQWNAAAHAYAAPYTPRIAYADMGEQSTSSSGTRRASTSHSHRAGTPHAHSRPPADDDGYDSPIVTTRKSKAPHSARSAHDERERGSRSRPGSPIPRVPGSKRKEKEISHAQMQAGGSRGTPRTPGTVSRAAQGDMPVQSRLIRRVTATVSVKQENESDAGLDNVERDPELESSASGSVYEPESPPKRRVSSVAAKGRRVVREWVEVDDEEVDEEEEGYDEDAVDDDELLLPSKVSLHCALLYVSY